MDEEMVKAVVWLIIGLIYLIIGLYLLIGMVRFLYLIGWGLVAKIYLVSAIVIVVIGVLLSFRVEKRQRSSVKRKGLKK